MHYVIYFYYEFYLLLSIFKRKNKGVEYLNVKFKNFQNSINIFTIELNP